jgi:ribosome-associated protein
MIAPGRPLPESELEFHTSRSGGPGGQNVNKVESRVEARWDVRRTAALSEPERMRVLEVLGGRIHADGTLRAVSRVHRTQAANRRAAVGRLALWVAQALRPRRKRKATRPTRASTEQRLEGKRRRAALKESRRSRE